MMPRAAWALAAVGVGATLLVGCMDESIPAQCVVVGEPSLVSLAAGQTVTIAASASCVGVPTPRVMWTSSAPAVATVDSMHGIVRGVSAGSATLHAAVASVAGRGLDVRVLVFPCERRYSVTVTPSALTLPVGGTGRLRAAAPNNCTSEVDSLVTWSSADATVATVDASGTVRGVHTGQTAVRAALVANPSIVASIPVTVTTPGGFFDPPAVSPTFLVLAPGGTGRLTVHVPTPPTAPPGTDTTATFRSANPCIASVSSDGLVTAYALGTTTITVAARRDSTLRTTVGVGVAVPTVLRLTFESMTTGSPPASVDLAAVRGTINVTMHVDPTLVPAGGRLDLALGDRVAATQIIPTVSPLTDPLVVALSIATDARDAAGARLYANGPTGLTAILVSNAVPSPVAGCATAPRNTYTIQQSLTLANP